MWLVEGDMQECDGSAEGADGCAGALAAGEHERRAATPNTSNIKSLHQQLLFVMDMEDDAGLTGDRKGANTAAASTPSAAAARSDRHFSAWKDDDFICSAEDLAAARGSWTEQVVCRFAPVVSLLCSRTVGACCSCGRC
jgi:hypothetical protein